MKRAIKTIGEAIRLFQASRIAIAICLVPSKSRVYKEFLPDDFRFGPDAERRYATALQELRAAGVIVPDLAGLFAAVRKAMPGVDLFFRGDTHWLPPAAEQAAIEMARLILAAGKLPPSTRPGSTLDAPRAMVQNRNDLAALLPPELQVKFPPQRFEVRLPAATGPAGLLVDDNADVLVIGNSFAQPNYGYAPMLSNRLGRPVALSWRVHQFSPYWSILNYLKGEDFRRQRPNFIVWYFQEFDMETSADDRGAWGPNAMAPAEFLAELGRTLKP
jgi:alginate O-acetyltransferase complex protein AlgJ